MKLLRRSSDVLLVAAALLLAVALIWAITLLLKVALVVLVASVLLAILKRRVGRRRRQAASGKG